MFLWDSSNPGHSPESFTGRLATVQTNVLRAIQDELEKKARAGLDGSWAQWRAQSAHSKSVGG